MAMLKKLQYRLFHPTINLGCALLAGWLAAAPATAEVIIDDPFTDGARTNGADPQDSSWSAGTVADDPVIGDGNALFRDVSGGFQNTTTNFSSITLDSARREKLRVEFDLHITEDPIPAADDGFRFGLRNSSDGTQYHARFATTAVDGTTSNVDLAKNGTGTFGGGSQIGLQNDANGSSLNDNDRHYARFTVQYTSAGRIDLRGRIDTQVVAAADTGAGAASINTTFNQGGFQNGSAAMDHAIDNYRITRWYNVIDDTFDVGSTPTLGNDGDDPNDNAWSTISSPSISLVNDDDITTGQIGSNNALLMETSGTFQKARTQFSDVVLKNNYSISASFDFRILDTVESPLEDAGGGFRFGLYDDGSGVSSDTGYFVTMGTGANGGLTFIEDGSTGGDFLGGSGQETLGSVGSFNLDETLAHLAEMVITRVDATTVSIELYIDGKFIGSTTDSTANNGEFTSSFGAFGISSGNSSNDFIIDNVVIDYMVPTPAALPAGLILICGLAMRRR
ncbi:hypothetical protein HED60_03385 [Planctomycetales bacterium ZRK34]|nr:hypothetical protein HED60_03385 [Planctomycetales bacterium ZRK34]